MVAKASIVSNASSVIGKKQKNVAVLDVSNIGYYDMLAKNKTFRYSALFKPTSDKFALSHKYYHANILNR